MAEKLHMNPTENDRFIMGVRDKYKRLGATDAMITEIVEECNRRFRRLDTKIRQLSQEVFGSAQERYARQEALIESLSPWKRGKIDG